MRLCGTQNLIFDKVLPMSPDRTVTHVPGLDPYRAATVGSGPRTARQFTPPTGTTSLEVTARPPCSRLTPEYTASSPKVQKGVHFIAPKDNLQIANETVAAINAHDIEGYLKHIDESYAGESETLGTMHGH